KHLVKIGCNSVLCEGGGEIATTLLKNKLVDRMVLFYCPKIIGGDGKNMFEKLGVDKIEKTYLAEFEKIRKIGQDVMLEIVFKYKTKD
ncbi:MAG: RibD family protein, partial [Candidatus Anstonellaceae archaeon]